MLFHPLRSSKRRRGPGRDQEYRPGWWGSFGFTGARAYALYLGKGRSCIVQVIPKHCVAGSGCDFCGSEVLAAQAYRVLQVQDLRFRGDRTLVAGVKGTGFGLRVFGFVFNLLSCGVACCRCFFQDEPR